MDEGTDGRNCSHLVDRTTGLFVKSDCRSSKDMSGNRITANDRVGPVIVMIRC